MLPNFLVVSDWLEKPKKVAKNTQNWVFYGADPQRNKNTPLVLSGVFLWSCFPAKQKHTVNYKRCVSCGADNQIRTGDLVLTKDVLYLLSHISENIFVFFGYSIIPILLAKVNRFLQ